MKKTLLQYGMAALALFASAGGAQASELFRVVEPLAAGVEQAAATESYRIHIEPSALAGVELVLPLPGRASLPVRRDQLERRSAEDFTWRGFTAAQERVVLTYKRGFLVGLIFADGAAYEIMTLADGGQGLAKLDQERFPPCLEAPPTTQSEETDRLSPLLAPDGARAPRVDPASDIDLLGLYTPQSRDAAGGVAQIEATLQAAVDNANTSFIDSDMIARFDLVATALSTRNDSGDMGADLSWLAGDAGVGALRNEVGADMVSLIVNSGSACGVGFVMRTPGPGFASSAFQVTARTCAVGNLSFAHEHGHNMGFEHDPANGTTPANASFLWSFGHFVDGSYRTVMSYAGPCTSGCTRVAHFSNPDILHNGVPTGIADQRDNARTGDLTAAIVANFRDASAVALIFDDGFESGSVNAWSSVLP